MSASGDTGDDTVMCCHDMWGNLDPSAAWDVEHLQGDGGEHDGGNGIHGSGGGGGC
ncbi:hypothetical protein K523DRAFT_358656 [Schizophyllum commune Tattone D]|nr:hypothetical protein K523DRAFT_358656 [Schizophyllum commune Tattone D]